METKKGRRISQTLRERKPLKGGLRSRQKDTWLSRNWSTLLILVAIIFIALFVRTYFGYSTAVDNGFLVAGGSDSYYHQRVIDYIQETGTHLVNDPLLNYPIGMRNARPPLYDWSVAVSGQLLSGITGMGIDSATGYALLCSTAIWGALTCIPVFLITRAAFGNRAGIIAAFLLAIMPGHIQRSVFANADHDAMILFFVVFAFYFLLRSLMTISGTKWVSNWKSGKAITEGIRDYLRTNQRSLIYALLGGVCVATVAMMWTGFTYVLVIVLVYFLIQVVINRFRNVDSMGEFFIVGTMLLSAFLIMAPLYWQMNYWTQWFDVPFYLFLGSMFIGGLFTVTRDYPWTLVIPAIIILVAIALTAVFFISPSLFEAIVSGQGYLVKSKLYATIQEAQAPYFSDLALSFGAVTFWLALIGVAWAAIKIPRNVAPHFTFVVVWMGVSMYMAASAGRFMFNASPAFAMAAGWTLALFIGLVKFEEIPRALSGFFAHPWTTLRKAFKLRHVVAALFLAFMILLPNVWGAVDAGIPSEIKRDYDKQIYFALPDFLHPSNYDRINGSYWYLGAFSYSMPLPTSYWPTAWRWFEQQDNELDVTERPAFLSWWDYGFEAIQAGQHPTVSDNFQNGYQYAGSFITSQSENDAVALFIIRILEATGFDDHINDTLSAHGVDAKKLQDIMANPNNYIDEVKKNPNVYGPYDSELSAQNAKYAAARVELQRADLSDLVEIYHDLREYSGKEIGYFAMDSRLFPFSATYQSIFYAPAKLSDRNIDPYTNAPSDFYEIKAITAQGQTKSVQDLTSSDRVINYVIVYKEAFYDTMLYRTMMGYSPSDVGKNRQGIPGISGSLSDMAPMPAWNLTHFKQVYRTAYYSPYSSTEVANHADSWYAISYEEAVQRQKDIAAGKDNGTVDLSASTLTNGVVFIQYYDGAILQGRAVSNDGTPYENIYVTAVDEYGIPHDVVRTDEDGYYSLILPFGNISVVYSAGTLDKQKQVATVMKTETYDVSYDQAMRRDGVNYTFNGDITLPGSIVSGTVFWDNDGNGRYTSGDESISNATVVLENPVNGFKQEVVTDANGTYKIIGLAGGNNNLYARYNGHTFGASSIDMSSGTHSQNIAIEPAEISGTLEFDNGDPAPNVEMRLTDKTSGETRTKNTTADGGFTFDKLLPGEYSLTPSYVSLGAGTQEYNLTAGEERKDLALRLISATQVTGEVTIDGEVQKNVAVGFLSEQKEIWVHTDDNGSYVATIPRGNYTAYALTKSGETDYVVMEHFGANDQTMTLDLNMVKAATVSGRVSADSPISGASVVFTDSNGAYLKTKTNDAGQYKLFLMPDEKYFVYAAGSGKAYWDTVDVKAGATTVDLALNKDSAALSGTVYRDMNGNGAVNNGEAIANALLRVQSSTDTAQAVYFVSDSSGKFNIALPKGADYSITVSMDGYDVMELAHDTFEGKAENIALTAQPRSVTGTVDFEGTSQDNYAIEFEGTGGGAVDASANITDGKFTVDLAPGSYKVTIDREGKMASKYTYEGTLVVPVARDPEPFNIETVRKVLVNITLSQEGSGSVRFIGPENRTVNAAPELSEYLRPGQYTIYADITSSGAHYASLTTETIGEGSDIVLNTMAAYKLSGSVQYDNKTLTGTSSVTVSVGGASLPLTTGSSGTFSTYLPSGTYDLEVERAAKQAVDGVQRYVLYTGSESVTISDATPDPVDIATQRGYDNVTLSGNIDIAGFSGELEFTAMSETAMDATTSVTAGDYSIDLAPGIYSVYGTDGTNVVLRMIEVKPSQDNTIDLNTDTGYEVTGKVTYDGKDMSNAKITFTDVASHTEVSDESGTYRVILPKGSYYVSAIGTVVEQGVTVTWANSSELELDNGTTKDIELELQYRSVVEVEWDDTAKRTVDAGETVKYNIIIHNRGNVNDTYKLSTTSTWGVTFSNNEVYLPWGSGSNETIVVTIKTPVDAKVAHPLISIKATSTNDTTVYDLVALDVGINPRYAVEVQQAAAQTNGTAYVLPVEVKNTGNADDTYTFAISDDARDALAKKGWTVSIPGKSNLSTNIKVDAGKSKIVNLELIPRESPDPNASLEIGVRSDNIEEETTKLSVETLQLSAPDGPTVSGGGASMEAPKIPAITWLMMGLVAILGVIFVILKVNKGVFGRRRKR